MQSGSFGRICVIIQQLRSCSSLIKNTAASTARAQTHFNQIQSSSFSETVRNPTRMNETGAGKRKASLIGGVCGAALHWTNAKIIFSISLIPFESAVLDTGKLAPYAYLYGGFN